MDCSKTAIYVKGSWLHWLLPLVFWLSSFENVLVLLAEAEIAHFSSVSVLASPPKTGSFEPIEISPAVIPHHSFPVGSLPPMYPTHPNTYDPVLTGRCPVNFSAISTIMEITASDCNQPLAGVVGNVICCPQFSSLLHIFQGFYSVGSDNLVLQNAVADDCFKDIVSILASRGANSSIPTICSTKSSNLTGGSCPVKDITDFEKMVNTSKILEACSIVDSLKECCRPICQPVITEAALMMSGMQSFMNDKKNIVGLPDHGDTINDCKGVVNAWVAMKLSHDSANKAFRILSSCKVNRGCLLGSLPANMVYDNSTGFSFTCDLTDNIAAPWPSSSSVTTISLCAPEMSLPALPTSETFGNPGWPGGGVNLLVPIFWTFVFGRLLL